VRSFLALVACFYLSQPIEAFGLQGFPTGASGYPGLRSGLGVGRMLSEGNCTGFTREECTETVQAYSNKHMDDLFYCKQECRKEDGLAQGSKECKFLIWKKDRIGNGGYCERYHYNIRNHDKTCDHVGGPPLPSVDLCGADVADANENCLVETEIDCMYKDILGTGHHVSSIKKCQTDCYDDSRCKFFLFDTDEKICKMFASTDRTCRKRRAPRKINIEGCPKVSITIPRPSEFGDQCPSPSKLTLNADLSATCCCSPGCCFDKCAKERPDYECLLDNVPNSQWIYSKELGYWQTKQYKSYTTQNLNARTAQAISVASSLRNLLWNSINKQNNFGK
jgi:hypothetical protein